MEIVFVALIVAISCNIDNFVSSFAYGTQKIKIPSATVLFITVINCTVLAVGLMLGVSIGSLVEFKYANWVSIAVLLFLGVYKIVNSFLTKAMGGADKNNDKVISIKESIILAVGLGADAFAVGFVTGLTELDGISFAVIVGTAAIAGILTLALGNILGIKVAKKTELKLDWLAGVLLLCLGLFKLFC